MTEWFRRKAAKITTFDKKDIAEGSWQKCSNCGEVLYSGILKQKYYICSNCDYHLRMPSSLYTNMILDDFKAACKPKKIVTALFVHANLPN